MPNKTDLPTPETGKQPHPLPATDGQQRIDGADADIQRLLDGGARHRVDRAALQ